MMRTEVEELIRDGMKLPKPATAAQMQALRIRCGIREADLDDLLDLPHGTTRRTHDWRTMVVSEREAAFLAGFDAAAQAVANGIDVDRPLVMFHSDMGFRDLMRATDNGSVTVARLIYNEALMRTYYNELWETGAAPNLLWFDPRTYIEGETLHEWAERHLPLLKVKKDGGDV